MNHITPLPGQCDVVVVGAGYAGLATALSLVDQGVEAIVLEAGSRVGGRVHSEVVGIAGVIDHGGQWVGPTQHRLLDWAERFNCARFETWDEGVHLDAWADGSVRRTTAAEFEAPGLSEYESLAERINQMAAAIDLSAPASSPDAEALDSQTVASWLEQETTDSDARRRFALAVQGVWSVEPRDVSMLHLLFYTASAGSFEQLMNTRECAQAERFMGGAQAPALAAARTLGARIHLDTCATSVTASGPGAVEISTTRGPIRAQRVVIATPPPATQAIRFEPALPAPRRRWLQRSVMGDVTKVHIAYPTPFWRAAGLSGQASIFTDEPVGVVFDNSPDDGSSGILVAFVYGDRMRSWSPQAPEVRREQVLATLTRLFGEEAAAPVHYVERHWIDEPFIQGGYAAVPAPGAWVEHGAQGWREPVGPIHWAGTETASIWHGYIDGAISSGERAAAEVIDALVD